MRSLLKAKKGVMISRRKIEEIKNRRFRRIVRYVYRNCPFYRRKFKSAGIDVDKIESVETEKIYVSDFDENTAKEIGKKRVVEKSKPMSLEEFKRILKPEGYIVLVWNVRDSEASPFLFEFCLSPAYQNGIVHIPFTAL
jgi:hypothetical protein